MECFNLHTHHGYKILQHLTFEINHRKWGVELLISAQKMSCLFLSLTSSLSNIMLYNTQILSYIKQRFMTNLVTCITTGIQNVVKCCIKSWVHLDLRPNNMLFGRLQPQGSHQNLVQMIAFLNCRYGFVLN